jgi:hypothetical protein
MTRQSDGVADVVVYGVDDLRRVLGCGRPTAYRLAKRLGKRIGKRFIVSKLVFEAWLTNDDGVAPTPRRAKRFRKAA